VQTNSAREPARLRVEVGAEYRRRKGLLDASKRFLRYREDPGAYAREILGIEWWSRQIDIANSIRENRRTVVYAGHSVGKCVHEDDRILLTNGCRVRAGDLIGQVAPVWSVYREFNMRESWAEFSDNGTEDVIEITTETGRSIRRTLKHPLYAAHAEFKANCRPKIEPLGWTLLENIRAGDLVLVPAKLLARIIHKVAGETTSPPLQTCY
jgi:hypothetical protein